MPKNGFHLLDEGWDVCDGEPSSGDGAGGPLVDFGHVDPALVGARHRLQHGSQPEALLALVLEEVNQPVARCGPGSRLGQVLEGGVGQVLDAGFLKYQVLFLCNYCVVLGQLYHLENCILSKPGQTITNIPLFFRRF